MRIVLTADPELPVPPRLYGGIERIVDILARGLVSLGHEVTLLANARSATAGRLVPWPGADSGSPADTFVNALTLARVVAKEKADIVHSFSRVAYLTPILPMRIPKLMTYQRPIDPRAARLGYLLSRGTLEFTAISDWMMQGVAHIGCWRKIPNGVSLETYAFSPHVPAHAPLVFLGRIEEIKGPHLAIEIARRSNSALVLAGNIPQGAEAWFNANVAPHIDGSQITYVGPVDDEQKNALLGGSKALLMPILWDEPFGIVMAEALACGTPVIGLRRGAVPEVVEDGITGYVAEDIDGLVKAVVNIEKIDRADCRKRAERYYCADALVEAYLEAYARHATFVENLKRAQ